MCVSLLYAQTHNAVNFTAPYKIEKVLDKMDERWRMCENHTETSLQHSVQLWKCALDVTILCDDKRSFYLSAFSWSSLSSMWMNSELWEPLACPSQRTAITPKLLTNAVAQSTWNRSDTACPPGVPSLSQTHTQREKGVTTYILKINNWATL